MLLYHFTSKQLLSNSDFNLSLSFQIVEIFEWDSFAISLLVSLFFILCAMCAFSSILKTFLFLITFWRKLTIVFYCTSVTVLEEGQSYRLHRKRAGIFKKGKKWECEGKKHHNQKGNFTSCNYIRTNFVTN